MASVLILSSQNRNFPSDVDKILRASAYDSHRYESLQSFLASPMRARPFVAVFEIGTTEDLDRAVIAKEWIEHMQPAASVKVIAVFSNKNVSVGDKKNKFPIADILHFPITAKNLIFKLDLHLGILDKEAAAEKDDKKKSRKGFTLSGTDKITTKERVIVMLGPTELEGRWNGENETPTGKTRWRWIKNQQTKPGQPEDNFEKEISWVAESKSLPRFNQKTSAWELDDPEAELICLKKGVVVFSTNKNTAKKAGESLEESDKALEKTNAIELDQATQVLKNKPNNASLGLAKNESNPASGGHLPENQQNEKINSRSDGMVEEASPKKIPNKPKLEKPANEETRFVKTNPNIIIPTAIQSGAQITDELVDILKKEAKNTQSQTIAAQEKNPNVNKGEPGISNNKTQLPVTQKNQPSEITAKINKAAADTEQTTDPAELKIKLQMEQGYEGGINDKTGEEILVTKQAVPREEASRKTYINRTDTDKTHLKTIESQVASNNSITDIETRKKNEPQNRGANPTKTPAKTTEPESVAAQKNRALLEEIKNAKRDKAAAGQAASIQNLSSIEKKNTQEDTVIEKSQAKTTESLNQVDASSSSIPASSTQKVSASESFPLEKTLISPSPHSEEEQNIISAGKSSLEEATVLANKQQKEAEDSENYLKKRHFVLMTLEQLHDKNSSWHPIDAARIYLSAHHRYYGIKKIDEIFPLWIYEGELAPEFLEAKRSWKFYDRPPIHYISMATVPSYLGEPLKRLVGLAPDAGKNPQQMRWVNAQSSGSDSEGNGLLGEQEKDPQAAQKKKNLFSGLVDWISKVFGGGSKPGS